MKGQNAVTIVTAFFPIGRKEWSKLSRSDEEYLNHFAFWARIQNDLIVYTTPAIGTRVKQIRESFGRNNTTIIEVADWHELDREMYEKIAGAMQSEWARLYKRSPKSPESWNPDYNYVMYLKWWCLADSATKSDNDTDFYAWVDLGFNHGGCYYQKSEEFDFLWTAENLSAKIHLFNRLQLNDIPMFEKIRNMSSYIVGGFAVAPAKLCKEFFSLINWSLDCLCAVGLPDDDQNLMLMSYKRKPELFELHNSTWHQGFALASGRDFTVKSEEEHCSSIRRWWKQRTRAIAWLGRWYKLLRNEFYDDLRK